MKIRSGFVSNSSSSSFCILGFSLKGIDRTGLLAISVDMSPDKMDDDYDVIHNKASKAGILEVTEGSFAPLMGIVVAKADSSSEGGYLEEKSLDYYEFIELRGKALALREKVMAYVVKKDTDKISSYHFPEVKLYFGSKLC